MIKKGGGLLGRRKEEVDANGNIEVTLLIDANCVKALEPYEVIARKNRDPHAFKTLLRWRIVKSMYNQKKCEKLNCNRTMVKSVVTGLPSNHYFAESDKVRYLYSMFIEEKV